MDRRQAVARIESQLAESCRVKQRFSNALKARIAELAERMAATLAGGGTIYWIGNGGSAADAQHLAGELGARLSRDRRPFSSVALTTNSSILTSIPNDDSYEQVFARQIEALLREADLLVALSTSGNSRSVLRGTAAANARGAFTVGWTGKSGGELKKIVQLCLCVPSRDTQRIQESHITIGHIVCGLVEDLLAPRRSFAQPAKKPAAFAS
ncbi:MAG TPA: SIS domain-containing protein [Terriglobia bacterium]|nr:SIS domain-containing protein [Terriglobia bacterium]